MAAQERTDAARITLWLLLALVLAFAILGVVMAFAMGWTGVGMMGMGFAGMGVFMAIPAIVLVLILLAVLGAFDKAPLAHDPALEALNLRLARGEIGVEEYTALRRTLRR